MKTSATTEVVVACWPTCRCSLSPSDLVNSHSSDIHQPKPELSSLQSTRLEHSGFRKPRQRQGFSTYGWHHFASSRSTVMLRALPASFSIWTSHARMRVPDYLRQHGCFAGYFIRLPWGMTPFDLPVLASSSSPYLRSYDNPLPWRTSTIMMRGFIYFRMAPHRLRRPTRRMHLGTPMRTSGTKHITA